VDITVGGIVYTPEIQIFKMLINDYSVHSAFSSKRHNGTIDI